jgi:hypothetical protein
LSTIQSNNNIKVLLQYNLKNAVETAKIAVDSCSAGKCPAAPAASLPGNF